VAPVAGGRVGYLEPEPQLHKAVGENHGAPSALQVERAVILGTAGFGPAVVEAGAGLGELKHWFCHGYQ